MSGLRPWTKCLVDRRATLEDPRLHTPEDMDREVSQTNTTRPILAATKTKFEEEA